MKVVHKADTEMARIKAGDQRSFEKLFKSLYPLLCDFASSYLKDPYQAEELVQELFCSFWDRRSELEINTSIKSYLYSATRNRCLNLLRDEKRQQEILSSQAVEEQADRSAQDDMELDELQERVGRALNGLPEGCRQVFELSRNDGLKYKEIAERLSISVKTVENQMGKALRLLRQAILGLVLLYLLGELFFLQYPVGVFQYSGV